MNNDRLREIADAIEAEADKFDMSYWATAPAEDDDRATPKLCKTAGCIAGWSFVKYVRPLTVDDFSWDYYSGQFVLKPDTENDVIVQGAAALDLSYEEREELFYVYSGSFWTNVVGVYHETDLAADKAALGLRLLAAGDVSLDVSHYDEEEE